jgi:hypothetical protein
MANAAGVSVLSRSFWRVEPLVTGIDRRLVFTIRLLPTFLKPPLP